MLETPLHHCYLIPSSNLSSCIETLKNKLDNLAAKEGLDLSIDSTIIDTLNIEMARELRQRGQQKGVGETRCLIYGFDTITTEAQNALLKIIENPAEGTHFFFVTPIVSDLLETVRSRSWLLSDFCTDTEGSNSAALIADKFLAADGLAERLKSLEKLETKDELRQLVQVLASKDIAHENSDFGQALEITADYSRDSGASIKLLRQYIAIAASSLN